MGLNVVRVEHPLIDHSITILRDRLTTTPEFRRNSSIISKILILEATRSLPLSDKLIETPLSRHEGKRLGEELVVVPVLRAGLAMLYAIQDFLPSVLVGFIGLERDEQTAQAREYYRKIPQAFASHPVIILDPMLATGGSLDDTIKALKAKNASRITMVCMVAAPEGIQRINKNHPEVKIYAAAVDERLNDHKFIVPGLGDFGDRYFGTA
jgi:uracil phosphoribosyltransferase